MLKFKDWVIEEGWFFGNHREKGEFAQLYKILLKKHGSEKSADAEYDDLMQKYAHTPTGKYKLLKMMSSMDSAGDAESGWDKYSAKHRSGEGMMKHPWE